MRIAVLSSRFPYPLERGDKLRLFHQLEELSKRHEIHLYAIAEGEISKEDLDKVERLCNTVTISTSSFWQKARGFLRALRMSWPLQTGISYDPVLHQKMLADLSSKGIDVVYCQLIRMVPYTEGVYQHKVIDYMDALGIGMEKRAKLSYWPLKWLYSWEASRVKWYEKACASGFNQRVVITSEDGEAMNLDPFDFRTVPNGIDTEYFHSIKNAHPAFDVGFIGNLGYLPNMGAVQYLVHEIGAAYMANYGSKLRMLIAGARPSKTILALGSDHVSVKGWMDDIRNAYWQINILVAPIFYGTGQQNKILEAMACGIPVICSAEVANGVRAKHNEQLLVANSPEQFAYCIHLLTTDKALYQSLQQKALEHVKFNFSWERSGKILENILDPRSLT